MKLKRKSDAAERREMKRVLGKALLGYYVLKTLLSKAGLHLGALTALDHIEEIEAVLRLKPGQKPKIL